MDDATPLDLTTKTSLLSGHDMWTTVDVPDAGAPSLLLCDGPHGVRKQSGEATQVYDSEPATCFPRPWPSPPAGTRSCCAGSVRPWAKRPARSAWRSSSAPA
ncbi:hypothetical protein QD712_05085 [Streptomyces acidiscabies]|uniref:hypothetical protein n=1 Tax=Streptomyces acidiscabies TaxID=42234 RepID=UPI0030D21CDA